MLHLALAFESISCPSFVTPFPEGLGCDLDSQLRILSAFRQVWKQVFQDVPFFRALSLKFLGSRWALGRELSWRSGRFIRVCFAFLPDFHFESG